MPFQFTPQQITEIEALRDRAALGEISFADVYEYVGDLIDPDLDNDVQRVEAWLRRAEQANRNQGIFSDIRFRRPDRRERRFHLPAIQQLQPR